MSLFAMSLKMLQSFENPHQATDNQHKLSIHIAHSVLILNEGMILVKESILSKIILMRMKSKLKPQ